ncbi:trimethylamine--corrinoid methyltransferase [Dethiobacter alkaliphilus]|uniref:Trimethylamine:corrinoid methyltransferase-like protein n=1 Tax=Dethiobacter alkaliphilus AHT 1 TaxID=555088 RepID=C0GFQ1_DETAL|nr:trimethylamine--corrinoid methyltransferase [Dethiobacter alkaliphilus]EEG78011.1 Trimethylamine:corrinoid methyltransferase-like protein [Dethiobacter alkaliphilus AHT 1]
MDEQKVQYRKPLHVQPVERLTQAQVEAIHEASMKLLQEQGLKCAGEQAADVYRSAGCTVTEIKDEKQKQWKIIFPEKVLKKALSSVPSQVVLGARDPQNTLYLDANVPAVYFGTGSETNIYLRSKIENFVSADNEQNKLQYPVFQEEAGSISALRESARLIDHLEHADFFIRNVNIQDEGIDESNKDVNVFFNALLNCAKHVQGGLADVKALPEVISLAKIIAGEQSHLPLSFIVCPIKSPLYMVADSSEKVIAIAEENIPMVISSSPQGGLTAPVQEEGILMQINAEILAGIALAQFSNPGAPVLYGSVPVRTRLDTLNDCYGTANFSHYAMGCAQMARFYGIPCYSSSGVGDAKRPGIQAMAEKLYSYKEVASAGAHYIHYSFGLLDGTNIFSPLQAVLDNATIAMVKDLLRSPSFEEKHIEEAIQEIKTTAEGSGMFIRKVRKQLRRNIVSDIYEFISEGEEDQVFVQAQAKLDAYLADNSNTLPEETIQEVYQKIPGLLKQS